MPNKLIDIISAITPYITPEVVFFSFASLFIFSTIVLFFLHQTKTLGWIAGRFILIAQGELKGREIEGEYFVQAPGMRLSTKKIIYRAHISTGSYHPYIIVFGTNQKSYFWMQEIYQRFAYRVQANVILFDYPNVGNSTGTVYSQQQLVQAGMAQVNRLLRQGIQQNEIFLYGKSLGGAVSTLVASRYHSISVINDRSFSSLGNTIAAMCSNVVYWPKLCNAVCECLDWNLNAAQAYKIIYAKNKMLIFSKQDFVIHPKKASLFSAMKADFKKQLRNEHSKEAYIHFKKKCLLAPFSDPNVDAHNIPLIYPKDHDLDRWNAVLIDQSGPPAIAMIEHILNFVHRNNNLHDTRADIKVEPMEILPNTKRVQGKLAKKKCPLGLKQKN